MEASSSYSEEARSLLPQDGIYHTIVSFDKCQEISPDSSSNSGINSDTIVYRITLKFLSVLNTMSGELDTSTYMLTSFDGHNPSYVHPHKSYPGKIMRSALESNYGQLQMKAGRAVSVTVSKENLETNNYYTKKTSTKLERLQVHLAEGCEGCDLGCPEIKCFESDEEYTKSYIKAAREDPKLTWDLYPTITSWTKHSRKMYELFPDSKLPEKGFRRFAAIALRKF